jgi:formylglycine-generating enzyme required for sulfatase activity
VFYGCTPKIEGALNLGTQPVFDLASVPQPFLVAQSQTTQALYKAATGADLSHFKGANRPVEKVSWFDMLRFANALSGGDACYTGIGSVRDGTAIWHNDCTGLRLPTEREWEYAARAFGPFIYSGSDSSVDVGWRYDNSNHKTHPVGQLKPNAFGTYDMSGNVFEWCWDLHSPGDAFRVLRGGSWSCDADNLRAAFRYDYAPAYQDYDYGGRLSRSVL